MSDAADKVNEVIGTAKDKITEVAGSEKVQGAIGSAKEKLTEVVENE
ncbi:hypothetical protein [Gordonia sp. NPDC003950]